MVALEPETFWFGAVADIDLDLDLRPAKDDPVVLHQHLPAWRVPFGRGFLEDAENPLLRIQDCVACELSAIDTDKSSGTQAALDDVVADDNVLRLKLRTRWTKEVQTGGAAYIEWTLAAVDEVTFLDRDVRTPAFGLHTSRGAEASLPYEATVCDQGFVTPDHINPLPAPTSQGAVPDGQFVEARAFNPVMIAFRTDVADLQMFQGDAVDWFIEQPPIIQVQPVAGLATDA